MSLPGVITLIEVISTPFITAFCGPPSKRMPKHRWRRKQIGRKRVVMFGQFLYLQGRRTKDPCLPIGFEG